MYQVHVGNYRVLLSFKYGQEEHSESVVKTELEDKEDKELKAQRLQEILGKCFEVCSSSSESESEDDDVASAIVPGPLSEETATELASEKWFCQPNSKVAHVFELTGENGLFIPRCRSKSYSKREGDKGQGIQSLASKGLRLHRGCARRMSEEAQCQIAVMDVLE